MQYKFKGYFLLAPNCDRSVGLLIFWVLQRGLQVNTEKNISRLETVTQVVDKPSIGPMHVGVRDMVESSGGARCGGPIDGTRRTQSIVGGITVLH